ncbi:MAG: hypothetical protein P0107_04920 [Nitrosomonas sp.]|nr:hypothetical protein [Nitrosomonas sp.]
MALAIVIMTYWMLPRALDAVSEWYVQSWENSSPSAMGVALGVSWPQLNPIAQRFSKLEFWATFMRLGWLISIYPITSAQIIC